MRAEELRSLWQPKVAMVHSGTHLTEHPCGPYQPPKYGRGLNPPPRRQTVQRRLPEWRLRFRGQTHTRSRVPLRHPLEAWTRFRPYRRSDRRQTWQRRTTGNRDSQSSPSHPPQRPNLPAVPLWQNPSLPHLRELLRPLLPLMPLPGRTQARYRRHRSRPLPQEITKPPRQPLRNLWLLNLNHPLTG
jgi:hypothetical protein